MSEVDLVGKLVTGVISFGDLEANYQGMLFFRSLCDPTSSFHFQKDQNNQWILNGKFDIANYVNPDWDESFNESGFTKARWTGKTGLNQTLRPYCELRNSPRVQMRFDYYQTKFTRSKSMQYLMDLENTGQLTHRRDYDFRHACL